MGCDIHAYAERKVDGEWRQIRESFPGYSEDRNTSDRVYTNRNYEFFALLADVRNGNVIEPIAEPRGVPPDASAGYLEIVKDWEDDGHSHSYFTLGELKKARVENCEQTIDDRRLITGKDADGNITETCASTTGSHMGPVGKRNLFSTFAGEKNPLDEIIGLLEMEKPDRGNDEDIRMVFFFDN